MDFDAGAGSFELRNGGSRLATEHRSRLHQGEREGCVCISRKFGSFSEQPPECVRPGSSSRFRWGDGGLWIPKRSDDRQHYARGSPEPPSNEPASSTVFGRDRIS
jgi:hypothetical protein